MIFFFIFIVLSIIIYQKYYKNSSEHFTTKKKEFIKIKKNIENKINKFKFTKKRKEKVMAELISLLKKSQNNDIKIENIKNKKIFKLIHLKVEKVDFEDLFNIMLSIYLLLNQDKLTKEEILKQIKDTYGKYFSLKTTSNYITIDGGKILVRVPISVLNRIEWTDFKHLLYHLDTDHNDFISFKELLLFKENVLEYKKHQRDLILKRKSVQDYYPKDPTIDKYHKIYNNAFNSKVKSNIFIPYNITDDSEYYTYRNTLATARFISDFAFSPVRHRYKSHFNKAVNLNTYEINETSKEIEDDISSVEKYRDTLRTKYPLPLDFILYQVQRFKANVVDLPNRNNLPLNWNCQRLWLNCTGKSYISKYS